ncbi:DeoR/GlpR family DNA-binding transcription regulator [uncultured Fusobacterium sp.]|uniref:DeoR/GlpR family DNA-binding transcription regulator n=1 Tax=uncultured Fusobacterium sp. TaxID=159267 RepID=UPI0025E4041D|nr:DeoR/GlpR family DNA-binding transcription regulator [uncultured Fusobacterium sp.]
MIVLAEERREDIIKELEKTKVVKALELAKKYDVGVETIRRDFDVLEKQGILKKIYGGATLKTDIPSEITYATRMNTDIDEKNEIAEKAITLIEENDSIFLNDSSTNIFLSKLIKKKINSLTVITNSLIIASELSNCENYNIILAGGFLDTKEQAFFGPISEDIISQFIVNKAFLSVSSISLNNGITDFPLKEVNIQKEMIKYSKEVIILANSQKFETTALIKVSDLKNIKAIITDSKLKTEIYETYKKDNINIIF